MIARSPKISVAIPAYNAERFIEEAVQYLRKQTFKEFECIIVDDGSTDNTAEVVRRLCKLDARFKLILHDKNKGLATARNTGINAASAEYFITLDADDIFDEDLLKETYAEAKATEADIVVFNFDEYKMRKKYFRRSILDERVVPKTSVFSYKDLVMQQDTLRLEALSNIGWNKLYRRRFLVDNELQFNEELL